MEQADGGRQSSAACMVDYGYWKAALYLKNGLKTDPITVTPVLYLSNGQRYPLPPVTLEPSGTAVVDIGQGLASVGIAPYATLCGYAEIDINGRGRP